MTCIVASAHPLERGAKTLASLNHPNIAPIYGLEESSSGSFLAMEWVEETLGRLDRQGADRVR